MQKTHPIFWTPVMKRKTPPTKTYKTAPKRLKKNPPLVRQANTVRGGPEKKNIDLAFILNPPSGGVTGVISPLLTTLAQGTSAAQRLGRKTKLTEMILRYSVTLPVTSTGGTAVRIKVVYDKQCNGAAPLATDVLIVDSSIGVNNLDNADRFVTIMDFYTEPVCINNNVSISGVEKRKMDLEQIWIGGNNSGAITALNTGSVYMFAWQEGRVGTTPLNLECITRIRFVDN